MTLHGRLNTSLSTVLGDDVVGGGGKLCVPGILLVKARHLYILINNKATKLLTYKQSNTAVSVVLLFLSRRLGLVISSELTIDHAVLLFPFPTT